MTNPKLVRKVMMIKKTSVGKRFYYYPSYVSQDSDLRAGQEVQLKEIVSREVVRILFRSHTTRNLETTTILVRDLSTNQ